MAEQFQMLSDGAAMSMGDALKTMAIGLIVVFAVLLLLVVCIEILHALLKDKKLQKAENKEEIKAEERISQGVLAEAPELENAAEDGDFLAAISAAISVYTGKPNGSFVIKSIKKG